MTRRDVILATAKDAARSFAYYGRKDDEDLPPGAIEEALDREEVTLDEIVDAFRHDLEEWAGLT